jgi:3-phenylpropionate/trans-cinnamate dioxygenase ferredoxin component
MAPTRVAATTDIPDGSGTTVQVGEHKIALFRVGDTFYAIDDTCSHANASLGAGDLDPDTLCVACPLHGALFDITTGQARTLPAYQPVQAYPVQVEDDSLLIDLPSS